MRLPTFSAFNRLIFPLGALAALGLAACSGPRLEVLNRPVTETRTGRAITSSSALDDTTRQTLREEGLLSLYKSDPAGAIRAIAGRYDQQPTEARRQALAEMSSDFGDELTSRDLRTAVGHYLDAARLTERGAMDSIGQPGESLDRTLYKYCAARVARLLHELPDSKETSVTAPGTLRTWRLSLAKQKSAVDPRNYDIVVPANWLKATGIKWQHITQEGFGAAMVGHRAATPERRAADPMMPPAGRGFSLNSSFRFTGSSATLVVQDLMDDSDATIGGRTVPLAGDFSAALSFIYYERQGGVNKIAAMLRPGKYEDMIGMHSLQPFREDKTPLILVHGLLSTAEGWLPFVNLLLADPVVREQYQIVLFNYPNGNPIGRNAADLRDALAEFRKVNDPSRRIPHMRNMVILGHSMGGIISNMQIRSTGDRLYREFFTKDIDNLDLESEYEAELRRMAFFEANPDIDRAILMASPLRGSAFASNQIGQLGAWLIRLPFNLIDSVLGQIEVIDAMTDVAQNASQRPPNSVNALRPDNPVLPAVLELPVRRGVTIHSVIAQRNPNVPMKEGSDGVVAYTSAHLDEAVSEKIILRANHRSMVEKDETIEEVWRILYLHAGVKR